MKKRILSLLLAVVMVMSFIPPVHVHAADECSAGGEHDWSYSNYGSCYRQCSKCYSSGYVDHDVESWSVSTSFGSKQHSGTCKNCKDTISGYCSYSYGGEYGYNTTNHWQLCTVCGEAASKTNKHSLSTTSNGDGTHAAQCSTCGYTNAGEPCDYQYNSWMCESNASGHTLICSKCNHESASKPHTMGYKNYSNTQHYYLCTVCSYGQNYSSLQSCTFSYKNDGATHTATCKDCGNVISGQSHTFKDGVCACGAEKHDHAWKLTASGNQIELSCTGEGTCDVTDKGTLTITAAGGTYDGNAKTATVSRTGYMKTNGSVTEIKYTREGAYYALSSAPKAAGNYTAEVTYRFDGKSATAEVDFTISKANVTVTATGWEGDYDGAAHGITVDAGDLKVTYNGSFESSPTYTDVGTYTVTYEVEENSNYNITNRTGSADVKISKVDKTVTATGWEGEYDGNAHGITVNAPEGLTVEYSTTGNEYSYSSYNVPTFTDAGTYTVYYRVTGNKNYNIIDGTGSADVKISKVDKTVTATGWEGEYDGNAHGITVNAPEGLTVTYSESGSEYSYYSTAPTYKDAGTYTVYYRVTGNKNYNIIDGTGSADVKINKVNKTVTATGWEGEYDGNAHGITVNAPEGLTVEYSTNGTSYSSNVPTFTDAGTYTVYYRVTGNKNYNIIDGTGSADVKISKVDKTVTATGWEGEYDGNAHGITVNAPEGLKVEYSTTGNEYSYSSYNVPTFTDAGTYTVYYRVTGNKNYNIIDGTGSADVKINKVNKTVTATGWEGDYDGNAHGITVNAPEGVKVTYCDKEDGWYSSTNPTYKDAGTYTVYYEATAGKNYSVTNAKGHADVVINKADLQTAVTAQNYEGTYDGKPHGITVTAPTGVTVEYSKDGENWYPASYANSFTDVCEETTVYYKAKVAYYDEKNYETTETTGSATVKINPLDLATVVTAEDTEFTFNRKEYTSDPTYTPHSIKLEVDEAKVSDVWPLVKEFSTDGGATWSQNNPTFRDAGTYTVKYRVYVRDISSNGGEDANYKKTEGEKTVTINKAELPITGLVGYHGPYDGSTHYGFGYKYSTSYGDYFTLYWYNYLHKELNYSFSWKDESNTNRTLVVEAGEEPKLTDFPGFTKQNVVKVDSSKDTDASYGAHKVTVTIGSDNYIDKTFDYYVQIGPGGATAKDTTYPYDGTEHYIANYIAGHLYYWGYGEVYNFGSIKIEYREKGSDTWLPASQEPGQTEVGYKDVEWRVTMDSDQNGKFGEEENSFGSPEVFIGTNRVTITSVVLTATANDKTITYGDAPADNGITITGSFVSPDTEAVVDKSGLAYDHEYVRYDDVGEYDITPKGLTAVNYEFNYVAGKLTVVQKPVTILIDGSNKISVDESDLVNGDECGIDTITYYKGEDVVTDITAPGTYTAKVTLTNGNYKPENDVEFTIAAPDTTAPTGNINVTTHNWNSFLTGVTFDIYFKEGKAVTITAADDTGVASIQYFVSNTEKTLAEVKATTGWNAYTTPFTIAPDQKAVVYAKITDVEGNVAYICSNGMVFDGTPPKIDGVEDGEKYKKDTDFTVKDDNLDKVTVDGKEVKPDKDGNYTIKNDGKKHTIVATDKAGNKTEVTIKMTKAAAAKEDDSPASGDNFNLVFWGAALVLSMAALVLVIVNKRKFFRAGGKYGR